MRIGAMDIRSFGRFSEEEHIDPARSIIVVGDRRDIQQRSIETGVHLLVVTGNLPVDEEVVGLARARGVSLIISPHDSATTAWAIRTATRIERLIDRAFASLDPDARRKVAASTAPPS